MIEQDLTQDLWEQLTPQQISERFGLTEREIEVLRKRFDIGENMKNDSVHPPKGSEGSGSGGVPSPAKPPN